MFWGEAHAVKQAVDADYTAGNTAHAVKQAVDADYTAGNTAHAADPLGNVGLAQQLVCARSRSVG